MENDLEEYYNRYKLVFTKDFGYSRGFTQSVNAIIMRNLAEIHDHEKRTTEQDQIKDSQGADRTIKIPAFTCGIRVRRPTYVKFADFTMDTKEYTNLKQPEYYIAGYGRLDRKTLSFYMFWNQRQFIKLARENKIKHSVECNKEHSGVSFLAWKFQDIFDRCEILECGGDPETIRQVLDNRRFTKTRKLGEFV